MSSLILLCWGLVDRNWGAIRICTGRQVIEHRLYAPGAVVPVRGQHAGDVLLCPGVDLEGVVEVRAARVVRRSAGGEAGPGGLHEWCGRRAACRNGRQTGL